MLEYMYIYIYIIPLTNHDSSAVLIIYPDMYVYIYIYICIYLKWPLSPYMAMGQNWGDPQTCIPCFYLVMKRFGV